MGPSVTVLGCAGTYAGPGNACSGYLAQADGFAVVLDCGPGTIANLQRHLPLTGIDAVVLSHVHPDHWLDLPILRNALKYVLGGIEGVPVLGTAETRAAIDGMDLELEPTFRWTTITGGDERDLGPFHARWSRTDHPPETLAVRLDHGRRSLAYSADTGPGWSFAELGAGIDLAICEGTLLDSQKERGTGHHLSAGEAGEQARRSGVRNLVVTHVLPGGDLAAYEAEAAAAYGAPVLMATSGATLYP